MSFPDAFFLWLVSHYQGHEHIVRTNKDEGFSHLEDEDRAVEFVNQYGGENLIIETEYRQYTLYFGDHHAHYDIEYDPIALACSGKLMRFLPSPLRLFQNCRFQRRLLND